MNFNFFKHSKLTFLANIDLSFTACLLLFNSFSLLSQQAATINNAELKSSINETDLAKRPLQTDLNICSYPNILAFTTSLISELNLQLNKSMNKISNSNSLSSCFQSSILKLSTLLIFDLNPYLYCLDDDCTSISCSDVSGTMHNSLNIAQQNQILNQIRRKAFNSRPTCLNNTSIKGDIYSFQLFLQKIDGSCSSGSTTCFNSEIRARVTYKCLCDEGK
ncbi:MAG: hypothetical protein ABI851_11835 [Saprospiraceae bacterium]